MSKIDSHSLDKIVIGSTPCIDEVDEFAEYGQDIHQTLKHAELKHRVKASFMQSQRHITHEMRSDVIDWVIGLGTELCVSNDTIHLATAYVDRLMTVVMVTAEKLQLVAMGAFYVASKVEEERINLEQILEISDDIHTADEVLQMERLLLQALDFNTCLPTANAFLGIYCTASDATDQTALMAGFLAEMAILHGGHFMKYLPSTIGAASLALAHVMLRKTDVWPEEIEALSGYALTDLKNVIAELSQVRADFVTDSYLFTKYASMDRMCVAVISTLSIEDLTIALE